MTPLLHCDESSNDDVRDLALVQTRACPGKQSRLRWGRQQLVVGARLLLLPWWQRLCPRRRVLSYVARRSQRGCITLLGCRGRQQAPGRRDLPAARRFVRRRPLLSVFLCATGQALRCPLDPRHRSHTACLDPHPRALSLRRRATLARGSSAELQESSAGWLLTGGFVGSRASVAPSERVLPPVSDAAAPQSMLAAAVTTALGAWAACSSSCHTRHRLP